MRNYEMRITTNYNTGDYDTFEIKAKDIFDARSVGMNEAISRGYDPDDVQEPVELESEDKKEDVVQEEYYLCNDKKRELQKIGNNIAFDGFNAYFQFFDKDYFYGNFHQKNMMYFVYDRCIIGPEPTRHHYDRLGYEQEQILSPDDMRFVRDWYKNDYLYDICFFNRNGEISPNTSDIFLKFWLDHNSVEGSTTALQMAYKITDTNLEETLNLEKLKMLVIQKLLKKLKNFWSGMWMGPNLDNDSYGNARLSSEKKLYRY